MNKFTRVDMAFPENFRTPAVAALVVKNTWRAWSGEVLPQIGCDLEEQL
jgi:hypothetical protein